jgi:hypothetical protein
MRAEYDFAGAERGRFWRRPSCDLCGPTPADCPVVLCAPCALAELHTRDPFTVSHMSPDGRLRIVLEVHHAGALALAEGFGAALADLWLEGKFSFDE